MNIFKLMEIIYAYTMWYTVIVLYSMVAVIFIIAAVIKSKLLKKVQ
jgi:hypothetical protein